MKSNRIQQSIALVLAVATLPALTSCQTSTGQGAGWGAGIGAATGALFGNEKEDIVKAAAIGGALGAVAGKYHETQQQNQRHPSRQTTANPNSSYYPAPQGRGQQQTYPPQQQPNQPLQQQPAPQQQQQYPLATATNQPGVVLSPYGTNRKIDVSGFRRGDLAIDPTTERIFRIP